MSYPLLRSVGTLCVLLCMSWTASMAAPPKEASAKQKAAWANEWSEKVDVSLEYSFDSSGPDAWDPKEHPVVFVTTEGTWLRWLAERRHLARPRDHRCRHT